MPKYCVKFFNTLLSSDGHQRKVLQRKIVINEPETAKDAKEMAQREFEHLECIPDWHLHAHSCEVEATDVPAANELRGIRLAEKAKLKLSA